MFTDNARAACALLGRPLSMSRTGEAPVVCPPAPRASLGESSALLSQPIRVIVSFFPYPDEDRAIALAAWAAQHLVVSSSSSSAAFGVLAADDDGQQETATARATSTTRRGMLFVVCGDCEVLGVPNSSAEEQERGLDALRVEMLLKRHLSPAFTSGAAVAVEYARGGSDGARAREENCRLRRQQRAQLVRHDQDLMLLCEKWHVFVARDEVEGGVEACAALPSGRDGSGTSVVMGLGGGVSEAAGAARPSTAAVAKLRRRLHDWIRTRLERWDAAEGNAKLKLERKYSTREMFEKQTCLAAALRFEKRTGLSDLFALQSEDY